MALKILFPRFPERVLIRCGKVQPVYLPVSIGHICGARPDFHGFLWNPDFAMWIWLESEATLASSALLLTRPSDLKPVCSQPVDVASPIFIVGFTISAACTGIDCYYCIYIDICIYILRRSKRQAFQQSTKGDWSQVQGLVLRSVLKSGPFKVRTRHISCRRERMRSVMRSPNVSWREAERASSSSRDFFSSRLVSFCALPEGPSGKLVVMIVVF